MRSRIEPWGAWVRVESPAALVGVDIQGARALGLDGGSVWNGEPHVSAPLEAHVAVTSQCGAGCEGCYLDARPDGAHVSRDQLEKTLDDLAARGVFTVAFGGGEPTLRSDLGELASSAKRRGLMPVVTTSGLGMTRERARALRPFAQVNVSYDGAAGVYDAVRAFDGSGAAERAMGLLHEEGVAYGVNVVLTRDSFPALGDTLERARSLGAREAQLLRYKPAGRAARLDYFAKRLTRDQVRELGDVVRDLSRRFHPVGFRLRIDCSMVPLLSDALYERASDLKKLGVLGCEAGAALEAVRTDGRTAPCSFIDASVTSWGVEEPCRSCALREVCRGGCKAVARYVDGGDGPDPECPRVVRLRGSPSA